MLFRLLVWSPILYLAFVQPSWAISVKDFMRDVTRQPKEDAAPAAAAPMSLEDFLRLPEWKKADPALPRYFDGFRDALYGFNAVLQDEGIAVFCPVAGDPPIEAADLRWRIEAKLAEKYATEQDFAAYVRTTSLGLVALEVLGTVYPCETDTGETDVGPEPPQ